MAFLGSDAGIRARRVNQRDDGQAKFVRKPHQAQRLAITFGMGGTKIAQDVFLRVAALLRADDDDVVSTQPGKTADHRAILGEQPVAVEFVKICKRVFDVVQRIGPFGVPGKLDTLPGGEVQKNLSAGLLQFAFDDLDFLFETDAQGVLVGMQTKLIQLVLQFRNRLFEIKLMFHSVRRIAVFQTSINADFRLVILRQKNERPDLRPASLGDEV